MVDINLPDGCSFTMEVHPSDDRYVSFLIRRKGEWEPFETGLFARLLAADVDFYDIGANIGWYSILAGRRLGTRGTVHAFEPVPENVGLLARNASANALTNIRINPFALGKIDGTTWMFLSPDNKGDHRAYPSGEERRSISVGLRRFDTYFDRAWRKPLLIKMDTQGFEYDVLLGMGDILDTHVAEIAMVIEFWPHGLAQNGTDIEAMIRLLQTRGFVPWVVWEEDPRLCPASWADLARATRSTLAPDSHAYVNLFLSRDSSGLARLLDGLYSTSPSKMVPAS
jgi:FkbM family methyltransferase